MTTLRLPLTMVGHRRRTHRSRRRLDLRILALALVTTELAMTGGLPLVALIAQMVARVLFIAFTLGGLITFLLAGIGLVQKSTR